MSRIASWYVAGFFGGFDLCTQSGEFRLRVL